MPFLYTMKWLKKIFGIKEEPTIVENLKSLKNISQIKQFDDV